MSARIQLTTNFFLHEFIDLHRPHVRPPVDYLLVSGLQIVRDEAGSAVFTTVKNGSRGAWRPDDADSTHRWGSAADIFCPELSLQELFSLVVKVPQFKNGGIGVSPDQRFIHVDTGAGSSKARPARWGWIAGATTSLPGVYRDIESSLG